MSLNRIARSDDVSRAIIVYQDLTAMELGFAVSQHTEIKSGMEKSITNRRGEDVSAR
jgi:hypothetical protein